MAEPVDPLKAIEQFLAGQGELLVPVTSLLQQFPDHFSSVNELTKVLQNDKRFFVVNASQTEDISLDQEFRDSLGISLGPKVALRKNLGSADTLFRAIALQLQTLHESLRKAYQARDPNDSVAEKTLKQALKKAQALEVHLIALYKEAKKAN